MRLWLRRARACSAWLQCDAAERLGDPTGGLAIGSAGPIAVRPESIAVVPASRRVGARHVHGARPRRSSSRSLPVRALAEMARPHGVVHADHDRAGSHPDSPAACSIVEREAHTQLTGGRSRITVTRSEADLHGAVLPRSRISGRRRFPWPASGFLDLTRHVIGADSSGWCWPTSARRDKVEQPAGRWAVGTPRSTDRRVLESVWAPTSAASLSTSAPSAAGDLPSAGFRAGGRVTENFTPGVLE